MLMRISGTVRARQTGCVARVARADVIQTSLFLFTMMLRMVFCGFLRVVSRIG